MENIFYDNWQSVVRTIVITTLAYVVMVFFLRVSGKRTLTKMNAFDFIITVALGSTLAAVSLNKTIPLLDGMLAFFLLIFFQFILTWLSVRVKKVKNIITSSPTMLLYRGELLHDSMKKERITIEEIKMAARKHGIVELSRVEVMVLETTGDISIIKSREGAASGTLDDIHNFDSKKDKVN